MEAALRRVSTARRGVGVGMVFACAAGALFCVVVYGVGKGLGGGVRGEGGASQVAGLAAVTNSSGRPSARSASVIMGRPAVPPSAGRAGHGTAHIPTAVPGRPGTWAAVCSLAGSLCRISAVVPGAGPACVLDPATLVPTNFALWCCGAKAALLATARVLRSGPGGLRR